ncbi:XRE family transcriptional regulator [Listeria monocytogenes]|uniref:helix-turn-helix domain-containing protein n=1 Tax=Listeria ivanovii TaxID=1638 RepID=UPI000512762E|nr:helix-turn-helix transcriptional regulator [Listeria ivanovii]AIS61331.1 XRE family transcriptional regulator [Listeria ivanovii subsp. londoniensis]EAC7899123.1 XRE family transcriptional regulator [Listeria monocytogenes]HAC2026882.1 helix-turn-helix domain-containing protein [Listeria monocytogenes]
MSTELKYRVRAALALRGKNQSWLAQELNIHPGQLSRIINGRDNTEKHIRRIKEFLNIE